MDFVSIQQLVRTRRGRGLTLPAEWDVLVEGGRAFRGLRVGVQEQGSTGFPPGLCLVLM